MRAKNKRNLIIMAAMVVLLIGVFVAVQIINSKNNKGSDNGLVKSSVSLISFKKNEISKVSYQYRGEEWVNYKMAQDTWYNADDEDFPLASSAFANNFVEKIVKLSTSRQLAKQEEAQNYGLDDPYLTVRIENASGKTETLYLGEYNSMIKEYYLKIEGSDEIYTTGTDLIYMCRADIYDYATIESFPTYSQADLNGIVLKNDDIEIEFTYFTDGYETDLIGECRWFFKTPFSHYRSAETNKINDLKSDVIDNLQFAKLANYNPSQEDLEQYGLLDVKRQYIINYNSKDEETGVTMDCSKIVDFGNYDDESKCYYARMIETKGNVREVSDNIYLISREAVDALLGIDPLDYIYKYVIYVKITDVANENGNITFDTPDGQFVLENKSVVKQDDTTEDDIYYLNGELMDEDDVEDFYLGILSKAWIERIIYDKSTVITDKEPTYTITYNRNKDDYYGNAVVEYTEYDMNYYQATVNGVTDVLVNKRILDETMAQLKKMTEK
ncbi:MAG: DUF4340 domain-containing protein [Lachnospiraceae bacterium]|nr:DUF4340 domain-containing protein [Lachnospiraceae bacterium]MCI8825267.1 DUF4340 domain-containing protein [Lachnospiraceae bacterium]